MGGGVKSGWRSEEVGTPPAFRVTGLVREGQKGDLSAGFERGRGKQRKIEQLKSEWLRRTARILA